MSAAPSTQPNRPPRIPMDQAFTEAAAHVRNGLESLGIRWSDQAEQAAVCTLLIAASQKGWLIPWNPPASPEPIREAVPPTAIPINRPIEPGKLARPEAARPPEVSQDPPAPRPRVGQASDSPIVRAFREIAREIPQDEYQIVLTMYGVEKPEDFPPTGVAASVECYLNLKQIREKHKREADPRSFAHFEATEEGWR